MGVIAICSGGDTPVRIDTSQIPAVEVQILSKATLDFIQPIAEYIMTNPEERRRFEEWRDKRNGGKTNDRSKSHRRDSRPA